MSKLVSLLLIVPVFLCLSCSREEIETLKETVAQQNAHIARLTLEMEANRSQLAELTQELEARKIAVEKWVTAIATLTDENTTLKESLVAELEKAEVAAQWLENLPDTKRKFAESYGVTSDMKDVEALERLFQVLLVRDAKINELRIENEYLTEKFHEIMAKHNEYKEAIDKLKADGIDVDKYLRFNK